MRTNLDPTTAAPPLLVMPASQREGNNCKGNNQYHECPLIKQYPELPKILQKCVNENVRQIDMPDLLEDEHGIKIGLHSIQKIMKDHGVLTARRNGLTPAEEIQTINAIAENDPQCRWGNRLTKEKLGIKGIHIPRQVLHSHLIEHYLLTRSLSDTIAQHRKQQDPVKVAARHPQTRKKHKHGLWSIGPNEEWCIDGHEKIAIQMGISVWGIIDKFCRMELRLWAVPNARLSDLIPALYLQHVQQRGGMPLSTTADKGTELSKLIPLVTTMRQTYQPYITEEDIPAVKTVKSIYNITRERNWRPIWEKELGNILYSYQAGRGTSGFLENDPIHAGVSLWLWGKIVQYRLDEIVYESEIHRVRLQKKILLPSGACRIDMYKQPHKHSPGAADQLIPIPAEHIKQLLDEHDRPDLIQFGSDGMVALCERLYIGISSPVPTANAGWTIFADMISYCIATGDGVEEDKVDEGEE